MNLRSKFLTLIFCAASAGCMPRGANENHVTADRPASDPVTVPVATAPENKVDPQREEYLCIVKTKSALDDYGFSVDRVDLTGHDEKGQPFVEFVANDALSEYYLGTSTCDLATKKTTIHLYNAGTHHRL